MGAFADMPLPGDFLPVVPQAGEPLAGDLPRLGVWLWVDSAGKPIPNITAASSSSESLSRNLGDLRGKVAKFCPQATEEQDWVYYCYFPL